MAGPTAGKLRKDLAASRATWAVHPRFVDSEPIPRHAMGGITEQMPLASSVRKLNFKKVLAETPGNPFLYQRRVAQKLIPPDPRVVVTRRFVSHLTGKPAPVGKLAEAKVTGEG